MLCCAFDGIYDQEKSSLVLWFRVVRPSRTCGCGSLWVVGFYIVNQLTIDMSRLMIIYFTSHMFFKLYYDYSMLVSNYQIYYKYILELSVMWVDHLKTYVSWLFIGPYVHPMI